VACRPRAQGAFIAKGAFESQAGVRSRRPETEAGRKAAQTGARLPGAQGPPAYEAVNAI